MKKMRKVLIAIDGVIIGLMFDCVIINAITDNIPAVYALCSLVIVYSIYSIMMKIQVGKEERANIWALGQIMKLLGIPRKDEQ